jgi:hypothetical protein
VASNQGFEIRTPGDFEESIGRQGDTYEKDRPNDQSIPLAQRVHRVGVGRSPGVRSTIIAYCTQLRA